MPGVSFIHTWRSTVLDPVVDVEHRRKIDDLVRRFDDPGPYAQHISIRGTFAQVQRDLEGPI